MVERAGECAGLCVSRRTHRHGTDERVLSRRPRVRRRRAGTHVGGPQSRGVGPGQPPNRRCSGPLRTRGAVLHGRGSSARGSDRAVLPRLVRCERGDVRVAARRRRARGGRQRDRGHLGGARAAGSLGTRTPARPRHRRPGPGRRRVAEPPSTDRPGVACPAVCRIRRALREPHRAATPRGVRPVRRKLRRVPGRRRTGGRSEGSGPRRLSTGQHAVRPARRRPAADGRRLADSQLGTGDDRPRLLHRLRATGAGASVARRGADGVLSPGAGFHDHADPRRRA